MNQACNGVCVPVAGANDGRHCVCTESGTVCGSAFAPTCNLTANTLYTCTDGSVPLVNKTCDPGTCSANVVAGDSVSEDEFSSLVVVVPLTEFCIDQCSCQVANISISIVLPSTVAVRALKFQLCSNSFFFFLLDQ